MKKNTKKNFIIFLSLFAAFSLWTIVLRFIDVKAIGPGGSSVGLATINAMFHNLTGVHMVIYTITDWLGLVPVAFGFGFTILGLVQWIKRKHILQVDFSILVLGGFYILVLAAYLFFESYVVNYRPVLINGYLEASYPSSTTLLVMCVMPTAMMQIYSRIKNTSIRQCVLFLIALFIVFMVIGRLISGVHWLTDIVGGALLSASLVMFYHTIVQGKTDL